MLLSVIVTLRHSATIAEQRGGAIFRGQEYHCAIRIQLDVDVKLLISRICFQSMKHSQTKAIVQAGRALGGTTADYIL